MKRSRPGLLIPTVTLAAAFFFAPTGAPDDAASAGDDGTISEVALDFARPASVACLLLEQAPLAPLRRWSRELAALLNEFVAERQAEAADCRPAGAAKSAARMPG